MTDKLRWTLTSFEEGPQIATAYINGQIYTTSSEHPLFEKIVAKLRADDHEVEHLFDLADFANREFHKVSDRISVRNGAVFVDDVAMHNAMTDTLLKYLSEGNENLVPLVKFIENLEDNPSYNSRNQLWRFVERHGIHIDDDGYMIMYKGVDSTETPDVFKSRHSGTAMVNGEWQNNQPIRQTAGDVVSMNRRDISDDPGVACHVGLHVGAYSYANGFAQVLCHVRVNPANVVAVPRDASDAKVRVSEYEFLGRQDGQHSTVRW